VQHAGRHAALNRMSRPFELETGMKRAAALLVSMSLAIVSPPVVCVEIDAFTASYVLQAYGTMVGRSEWRLIPVSDKRFIWESRSESAGPAALIHDVDVTERSTSELHGASFRPLLYQYDRHAENGARNVRVAFDWSDGIVLNTVGGHTWRMAIPAGTFDKLSYLLVLMQDLADGRRSMQYPVADGGQLKRYALRAVGSETLETALGTLETLIIERLRHADDRHATLWCAPSLGYLPVKLEHRDGEGRLVSMHIESIEGMPSTARR